MRLTREERERIENEKLLALKQVGVQLTEDGEKILKDYFGDLAE